MQFTYNVINNEQHNDILQHTVVYSTGILCAYCTIKLEVMLLTTINAVHLQCS